MTPAYLAVVKSVHGLEVVLNILSAALVMKGMGNK